MRIVRRQDQGSKPLLRVLDVQVRLPIRYGLRLLTSGCCTCRGVNLRLLARRTRRLGSTTRAVCAQVTDVATLSDKHCLEGVDYAFVGGIMDYALRSATLTQYNVHP